LSKIELMLLASLMAVTAIGALGTMHPELERTLQQVAAALRDGPVPRCQGFGCIAPAAGRVEPAP
jgi:Flp pilus assembly pilin Flp